MALRGELDLFTSSVLVEQLAEVEGSTLVLDLRGLSFIDCSGLHALCAAKERADLAGGCTIFVGASSRTKRLFELADSVSLLGDPRTTATLASFTGAPSFTEAPSVTEEARHAATG